MLLDTGRRKIVKGDGEPMHLTVIDELAYFSATVGTKAEREKFNITLRDCSARGRKCARRYVLATQRPSSDIVPTSLRDLFGYRWAFRCATDDSSDVVLGKGAANGYTAAADRRRHAASACCSPRASAFPAASRPPTSMTTSAASPPAPRSSGAARD